MVTTEIEEGEPTVNWDGRRWQPKQHAMFNVDKAFPLKNFVCPLTSSGGGIGLLAGGSNFIKILSFLPHRSRVLEYEKKLHQVPKELTNSSEHMVQQAREVRVFRPV